MKIAPGPRPPDLRRFSTVAMSLCFDVGNVKYVKPRQIQGEGIANNGRGHDVLRARYDKPTSAGTSFPWLIVVVVVVW